MNVFELIYFSLLIWLAAWLANVIARSLDMHLFLASGITVSCFVILISLFNQIKVRVAKRSSVGDAQE